MRKNHYVILDRENFKSVLGQFVHPTFVSVLNFDELWEILTNEELGTPMQMSFVPRDDLVLDNRTIDLIIVYRTESGIFMETKPERQSFWNWLKNLFQR